MSSTPEELEQFYSELPAKLQAAIMEASDEDMPILTNSEASWRIYSAAIFDELPDLPDIVRGINIVALTATKDEPYRDRIPPPVQIVKFENTKFIGGDMYSPGTYVLADAAFADLMAVAMKGEAE